MTFFYFLIFTFIFKNHNRTQIFALLLKKNTRKLWMLLFMIRFGLFMFCFPH